MYFRSHKRIKVLAKLTLYLLQYKRVCIPDVGTFEIVQQAPQLRVADQMMTAPQYRTHFTRHNNTSDIPTEVFSFPDPAQNEKLESEWFKLGQQLHQRIHHGPYHWNGFGTFRLTSNQLTFEPQVVVLESLQKIPAQKVIRPNVAHHMLVGDQETTTHQMSEVLQRAIYKKPLMVVAWLVLFLALLTIGVLLYVHHFEVSAAGLKLPAL